MYRMDQGKRAEYLALLLRLVEACPPNMWHKGLDQDLLSQNIWPQAGHTAQDQAVDLMFLIA
jgi:hypothetical protein